MLRLHTETACRRGGSADPVRVFAALHTPRMGAWYQVLRGDLPDLLGYTPMMTKALVAGPGYARDAYGLLRTRVLRLANRLLGNQLPADPALWRPDQVAELYRRCPDLTGDDPTGGPGTSPGRDPGGTPPLAAAHLFGAPVSEVELLTEPHHALAEALRIGGQPQLPEYWRLRLGPGGADEHVWRTFTDWPDLITVVDSAKHLATDARNIA